MQIAYPNIYYQLIANKWLRKLDRANVGIGVRFIGEMGDWITEVTYFIYKPYALDSSEYQGAIFLFVFKARTGHSWYFSR